MTRLALDVKTFAQAAADLEGVLDSASAGGKPVIITREDGEPVVVVPLLVWNARAEVERAAEALDETIAELAAGGGVETELGPDGFYVPLRKVAAA